MRTDGYLFTYAEMSASIDDTTFQANDTPITDPNNKIVTVQDAMDMIVIEPLNGPSNRCPSWDELIDNGGGGGGDFKVVLTLTTGVLSGYCYNGTPPYNYFFSCTPIGPCSSYSIGQPTFLNAGAVVTTTLFCNSLSGCPLYTSMFRNRQRRQLSNLQHRCLQPMPRPRNPDNNGRWHSKTTWLLTNW